MKNKKAVIQILPVIILAVVLVVVCFLPRVQKTKNIEVHFNEFSDVSKICELATLKCYYHNVGEWDKSPDGFFNHGLVRMGYKKFWIEYDGVVRVGIDVNDVKIGEPDKDGVVAVYVPEAKVLDVSADMDSMTDLISDTGWFETITAANKAEVFAEAQEKMREASETDNTILSQARNNAKELLKQYITKVGEQIGKSYTVQWTDDLLQ